jgi:hypothetical protein
MNNGMTPAATLTSLKKQPPNNPILFPATESKK